MINSTRYKSRIRQVWMAGLFLLGFVALTALFTLPSRPALAHHCVTCTAGDCAATKAKIISDHVNGRMQIKQHMAAAFQYHQDWWEEVLWKQILLPAMMHMSTQLSASGMFQMFGIGMLLDAKHQLETQQMLQLMQAKAHKDYHPSNEFCIVGSNTRSLAASSEKSRRNIAALGDMALERNLGTYGHSAAEQGGDKRSRWKQFTQTYCNKTDNAYIEGGGGPSALGPTTNNTGLDPVCNVTGDKNRLNIDIDYRRQIEEPLTIDADFMDDAATKTPAEEDLIALSRNLYGHTVPERNIPDIQTIQGASQYLNLRAVSAKRAAAQSSFDNIAGMKFSGSDEATGATGTREKTAATMGAILKQLGMPENEIPLFIGEKPSTYAQLEILSKKIFQSTDFFAGLYDKPANVERRKVAMAAVGLMVERAIYESRLRQEMLASVLVAARLKPEINRVQTNLAKTSRED